MKLNKMKNAASSFNVEITSTVFENSLHTLHAVQRAAYNYADIVSVALCFLDKNGDAF